MHGLERLELAGAARHLEGGHVHLHGDRKSKDGQTGTASITYTVAGPPTATITSPADSQTYNLGQSVAPRRSRARMTRTGRESSLHRLGRRRAPGRAAGHLEGGHVHLHGDRQVQGRADRHREHHLHGGRAADGDDHLARRQPDLQSRPVGGDRVLVHGGSERAGDPVLHGLEQLDLAGAARHLEGGHASPTR